MSVNVKYIDCLVNHLLIQDTAAAMEKAIRDLLTPNELTDVANRLQIFEMLEQGIPQRQIADNLGVGIATVTRGSSTLKKRNG